MLSVEFFAISFLHVVIAPYMTAQLLLALRVPGGHGGTVSLVRAGARAAAAGASLGQFTHGRPSWALHSFTS
jgi:hypothetical protein